jgi:hypothetical protein
MTDEQPGSNRPGILAFAPALFLFIGIYSHVLLLLFVGLIFTAALLKEPKVTKIWGAITIAMAVIAGVALWEPTPIVVPRHQAPR